MTVGIGEGIAITAVLSFLIGYSMCVTLGTMVSEEWKPHVLDIIGVPILILFGVVAAPFFILVLTAKYLAKAYVAVKSFSSRKLTDEGNDQVHQKTRGIHP